MYAKTLTAAKMITAHSVCNASCTVCMCVYMQTLMVFTKLSIYAGCSMLHSGPSAFTQHLIGALDHNHHRHFDDNFFYDYCYYQFFILLRLYSCVWGLYVIIWTSTFWPDQFDVRSVYVHYSLPFFHLFARARTISLSSFVIILRSDSTGDE